VAYVEAFESWVADKDTKQEGIENLVQKLLENNTATTSSSQYSDVGLPEIPRPLSHSCILVYFLEYG